MATTYRVEPALSAVEFRGVLVATTLGDRRPVDDPQRLERMLRQADLIVTARWDGKLVGVARSVTDFSYCCYLSDLAVDEAYQRQGIGRQLIATTHEEAGRHTTLVLIAAPGAESYYTHIGMEQAPSCWTIRRSR